MAANPKPELLKDGRPALSTEVDAEIEGVEWPVPVNVLRKLSAVPYDDTDVPGQIGDYAQVWALAGGFDTSLPIVAAIAAAAAVIDDRIRLEVSATRGWYESARIWALSIGGPGSGKTPAQKAMLAPVFELHREEREAWDRQNAGAETKSPQPRLFVSDVTLEKLSEVLVENEGGVLLWNDELGSIIGSHDQYRSGGAGKDRYEWMRLFDGGPNQIERVQRGTVFVPNWGASMLTATTPHALKKLARKLDDDGLFQRFVLAVAGPRRPPIDTVDPSKDRARYEATLRRLRSYRSTGEISIVRFSPGAAAAFAEFDAANPALTQAADSLMPSLGFHLAKHPLIVPRLALIFHAVTCDRHPAAEPVSRATVELAIRFAAKARHHALAVCSTLANETAPLDVARDVARWILADAKASAVIDRRDAITRIHSFRKQEPDVRDQAMTLLVDYGWLSPAATRYEKGRPTRWDVNPKLRELFADQAETERQLRRARYELLQERTDAKC